MTEFIATLSAGVFCFLFATALGATVVGRRRLARLAEVVPDPTADRQSISIISPACDEADSIEAAVQSWLAQSHPRVQVVVVDDRSTDRTGTIIDRIAATDSRVVAVHIRELPSGWLGKLNAMRHGIAAATGEWLLIADADAHLGRDTVRKAVTYATQHERDFLSVIPQVRTAGFLGDAVWNVTLGLFNLATRPWRIPNPETSAIGASGAFLLVRRAALERGPGLEWLRLEVADDYGMCLLIKSHGGSAELLVGREEVVLTWYSSIGEMARRMQKNFYAITGRFSLVRSLVQAVAFAVLGLWPLLALLVPTPAVLGLVGLGLLLLVGNTWLASVGFGRSGWAALGAPLGFLLIALIVVRSALIGRRIGGIEWRGERYAAADLKARQHVRF